MGNTISLRDGKLFLVSGSVKPEVQSPSTGSATQPSTTGSEYIASFQLDPNDLNSFYISGSSVSSSFYMSSSGKIGFGTTNPEAEIDFRADDWKIRKRAIASGIRMNEDGNFESFNNDTTSAATGSEIILKYTRGTKESGVDEDTVDEDFYKKTIAQANDTLGSIRWVADSGSLDERVGGEAGSIKMQVATSDTTGVTGKLSINIAADPGEISQQLYLVNGATQQHEFTGSAHFNSSMTVNGILNLKATDPRFRAIAAGANHPGYELWEDSTRKWVIYNDPDESDNLTFKNNTTEWMKLSQTGNLFVSQSITASGNISASGDIIVGGGNDLYTDQIRRSSDSSTTTKINLQDEELKLYAGHSSNERVNIQLNKITIVPPITASSHISASGNIYMTQTAGTDNSVVVLSNGKLVTDEINAAVWGSTLLTTAATGEDSVVEIEATATAPNYTVGVATTATTATAANTAKTVRRSTDATHYPVFVTDNNSSATAESLYTSTNGLTFNPSSQKLTVTTGSIGRVESTTVSASGEVRGKMLQPILANFKVALSGDEYYIPLSEGQDEKSSATNVAVPYLAPYNGRLHKLLVRAAGDTTTHHYSASLYTMDQGDSTLDKQAQIVKAAGAGTHNLDEYIFTGSNANTITKGELAVIGIKSDKSSNLNYNVTAVFEWTYTATS
tara:strand:+ start:2782 stop:4806 length:2025 start_codon:yes stop_codon:yes gene_type:complete